MVETSLKLFDIRKNIILIYKIFLEYTLLTKFEIFFILVNRFKHSKMVRCVVDIQAFKTLLGKVVFKKKAIITLEPYTEKRFHACFQSPVKLKTIPHPSLEHCQELLRRFVAWLCAHDTQPY